jgi:hypothetical protein
MKRCNDYGAYSYISITNTTTTLNCNDGKKMIYVAYSISSVTFDNEVEMKKGRNMYGSTQFASHMNN